MKITKEIPKARETKAIPKAKETEEISKGKISKEIPWVHIFKCGECGQKCNKYHLMKAHTHSDGQVEKTKEKAEAKVTKKQKQR